MTPRILLLSCLLLLGTGCASLSPETRRAALYAVEASHVDALSCTDPADPACAPVDSPLLALGDQAMAASAPDAPRHQVTLLDRGQDALVARLHLIRAARERIELQSFIYDTDDSGLL